MGLATATTEPSGAASSSSLIQTVSVSTARLISASGRHSARDLADAVHLLCGLHGRHPAAPRRDHQGNHQHDMHEYRRQHGRVRHGAQPRRR